MATVESNDSRVNRPNFLILCMDHWQTHMQLPDDVPFPAMERLEAQGVTFDRQYCTDPLVIKGAIQGDPKILIQPMIELNELARKSGTKRSLVDATNATNVQSIFADFAIVNWTIAKEPTIDRRMQIALLVSPEDHSHDFVETVPKNTG